MVNLNRLFAREIKESDMIIGEEVELPERGYNMSQAIQVLADKGGYREGRSRNAQVGSRNCTRNSSAELW